MSVQTTEFCGRLQVTGSGAWICKTLVDLFAIGRSRPSRRRSAAARPVTALRGDKGKLWVGAGRELYCYCDEGLRMVVKLPQEEERILGIWPSGDGVILLSDRQRVWRWRGESVRAAFLLDGAHGFDATGETCVMLAKGDGGSVRVVLMKGGHREDIPMQFTAGVDPLLIVVCSDNTALIQVGADVYEVCLKERTTNKISCPPVESIHPVHGMVGSSFGVVVVSKFRANGRTTLEIWSLE